MTTAYIELIGPQGSEAFDVTEAGDAFTECVNVLANLPLDECMLGQTVTSFSGSKTVGASMARVRNTNTNKIKFLEALGLITYEVSAPCEFPFVVEKDDVLELFHKCSGIRPSHIAAVVD